jgi:HK97 family phage major capsid protein
VKKKLAEVGTLPKQFRMGNMQVREVERAADAAEDAPRLYDISISSEAEVERWFGIEVLSHESKAVDMTRLSDGAAVLVDHGGDQVGVVESARLEDGVLRGVIRFSQNARGQEIERDVRDGIRRNVSVGYFVKQAKRIEDRQGVDVWKVTRWQPAEVSIVSVPADYTIGVGRSAEGGGIQPVELEDGVAVEEDDMKKVRAADGSVVEVQDDDPRPAVTFGGGDNRAARNAEVLAVCAANGLDASAVEEFTRDGGEWANRSVAEVAVEVAKRRKTERGPAPASSEALGLGDIPAKDLERYSYHRAIRQTVLAMENPHNAKFDGVEAEVHRHLETNWPKDMPRRGGFLTPMRTRTLASTIAGKGGEVVAQQAGELIELLRARAIVLSQGARLLTGLTGPVGFPRITAGASIQWVPENPVSDTPAADPSLGIALLSPKTMQGVVPFTRQLAMQSSIDIESWVKDELATLHGLAIDKAAIHGTGMNGQPQGIYNAQGVSTVDFASTFADIATLMSMVTTVADNNADFGTMRWLASVILAGRLRVTQEFGQTNGQTLWSGNLRDGQMLGYGAASTTQASKAMNANNTLETGGTNQALVFGNWADLLVALFGAMEFVVDPFTKKAKNIIEVATFQMGDVLPRHGQSFVKALNLPPA